MYDLNDSPLYRTWTPYRGKFTFLVRFLLFIVVIYLSDMLAAVPASLTTILVSFREFSALFSSAMSGALTSAQFSEALTSLLMGATAHPIVVAMIFFGQGATAAGLILYVLFVERRPVRSIGLATRGRHILYTVLSGVGLGLLVPLIALGICYVTGAVTSEGVYANPVWLPLFVVALFVQAFADELLYRGYFLSVFMYPGRSPWFAIVLTSLFSVIPLIGSGTSAFGFINTAVFGLLLSVLTVRTGSVWLSSALSALRSMVLYCILGGSYLPTIWRVLPVTGHDLVSGGGYGLENSLAMTLVLVVGLMLALFIPSWKRSRSASDTIFTVYQ